MFFFCLLDDHLSDNTKLVVYNAPLLYSACHSQTSVMVVKHRLFVRVYLYACVCVFNCVRWCVPARLCMCARACVCVRARVCVGAYVRMRSYVYVCGHIMHDISYLLVCIEGLWSSLVMSFYYSEKYKPITFVYPGIDTSLNYTFFLHTFHHRYDWRLRLSL